MIRRISSTNKFDNEGERKLNEKKKAHDSLK